MFRRSILPPSSGNKTFFYSSALRMEAACSCKILISIYLNTRCRIPQYSKVPGHIVTTVDVFRINSRPIVTQIGANYRSWGFHSRWRKKKNISSPYCGHLRVQKRAPILDITNYCILFSRLHNVSTSSCAHLTIILSSSSSYPLSFQSSSIKPFSPVPSVIPVFFH